MAERGVKDILQASGWLAALAGLYAGVVGLEYYWNVPDWQPRLDAITLVLFFYLGLLLGFIWFLSSRSAGDFVRLSALTLCFGLLAIGLYVAGPEPLKPGFLGRQTASPLWYRAGRLAVLCVPVVLWRIGANRSRRSGSR